MRSASAIGLLAIVLLLVGGAAGVYAYDSSRDDRIAEGISVGGVDVGGLTASEAKEVLKHDLVEPLKRPVRVKAAGSSFTLSPRQADVKMDIGSSVDAAVARSRDGNLVSRTVRDLTGGSEDADLPADMSYSKKAVARLVDRVKSSVDQPAQDASVDPSGSGLEPVRARKGRAVQAGPLEEEVTAALEAPGGERAITAQTRVLKPDVTTDEVADKYPHYIT